MNGRKIIYWYSSFLATGTYLDFRNKQTTFPQADCNMFLDFFVILFIISRCHQKQLYLQLGMSILE